MVFEINSESSSMKQREFERLSESHQVDILYHDGVYIGKQKGFCSTLLLFQLESFYVEIDYLVYRMKIYSIECFASTSSVDPYYRRLNYLCSYVKTFSNLQYKIRYPDF